MCDEQYCPYCGADFKPDDQGRYPNECWECKRKISYEFEENEKNEYKVYVGFWKRVIASLIDAFIFTPIALVSFRFIRINISNSNLLPSAIFSLILFCLQWFLIVKYGGTPGKLIMEIQIINNKGNRLSIYTAITRSCFSLLYSASYYVVNIFHLNKGNAIILNYFLTLVLIIDVLVIVFNKKKRALHDYLAGSFVVKKNIYQKREF